MVKKNGNIGVDGTVKDEFKALSIVTGYKTIRDYMRHLADYQIHHLSISEYDDFRCFMRRFEGQNKTKH